MQKVNFSSEERKEFQRLIKEFIDEVERMIPQGTPEGSEPSQQEKKINEFLRSINYVSRVNYGSGNLSDYPAISFYRKDILGEEFTNGEKATLREGIYIWFSYNYKNKRLYLKIATTNKVPSDCKALKQIKKDTNEFTDTNNEYCRIFENFKNEDFEKNKEEMVDKFLELVNYFNTFSKHDFKKKF